MLKPDTGPEAVIPSGSHIIVTLHEQEEENQDDITGFLTYLIILLVMFDCT